jgi:hypothetical protein
MPKLTKLMRSMCNESIIFLEMQTDTRKRVSSKCIPTEEKGYPRDADQQKEKGIVAENR